MRSSDRVDSHHQRERDDIFRVSERVIADLAARINQLDVDVMDNSLGVEPLHQCRESHVFAGLQARPNSELESLQGLL